MPLFRCFIRGENFPGKLLSQKQPVGFYTTRFVEAESPQAAELLAVELLRAERGLQVAEKHRTKDARVFFESIEQVPEDTDRRPNSGFTFFTMGT